MNSEFKYNPINYIGKNIKDNEFIEILELFSLDVIYEFDRLHENIEDIYWIKDHNNGCTFRANKDQIIVVSFVYLRPHDNHKSFEWELPGITIKNNSILELGNPTKSGSYNGENWVRYDHANPSTHLSWDALGLKMITFSHDSCIIK